MSLLKTLIGRQRLSMESLYKSETKAKPASEEQIKEAEAELDLKFPRQYVDYLKTYGSITYDAREFTGLNTNPGTDVVAVTKSFRESTKLPPNLFVIEPSFGDGPEVVCDQQGKVFEWHWDGKPKLVDLKLDFNKFLHNVFN